MIRITGLEIEDCGPHKELKAVLEGNVVGLTGPNGRGKTTVIQAIQLGLTGTIDHPDPLREFIRKEAGEKPPKAAKVVVRFVSDGKEGVITRRITRSTNSRKLEWDGQVLTSDKKVAAVMLDILGVDKKAINSTVFIRQGEMTSMFGAAVDRREFYTRLLMLGDLEKIALTADIFRKQVGDSIQDLATVRDAAEKRYEEAADYFREQEESLKDFPDRSVELDALLRIKSLVEDLVTAEKDQAAVETVIANEVGPSVEDRQRELRSQITAIKGNLDAGELRRESYTRALRADTAAQAKCRELQSRRVKHERVRQAQAALDEVSPVRKFDEAALKRAEDNVQSFGEIEILQPEVERLQADLSDLPAQLQEAEVSVQNRASAFQELEGRKIEVESSLRTSIELRDSIRKVISSGEKCKMLQCPLCGNQDPEPDFINDKVKDLQKALSALLPAYEEAKAGLEESRMRREELRRRHDQLQSSWQEKGDRLKRLRAQLIMTSREREEEKAVTLRIERDELAVIAAEKRRREVELSHAVSDIFPGEDDPSDEDMEAAEAMAKAAAGALASSDWTESDAAELVRLNQELEDARAALNRTEILAGRRSEIADRIKKLEEDVRSAYQGGLLKFPGWKGWSLPVTVEDLESNLSRLREDQEAYQQAKGRKEAANRALVQANESLNEVELRIAEQEHRQKLVDDLTRLRDAFKPSGLTTEFLDYKFGQIARLASDYLAESQANFMVAAAPDAPLSFEFIRTDRPDEVWMPQSRLSGGQKVRLAVATLRAIHSLVIPNVGLLVLDEPTTHLDEEAKSNMAEMLQRIGGEGGLQMIVCDHSPTLIDAFSDVISL